MASLVTPSSRGLLDGLLRVLVSYPSPSCVRRVQASCPWAFWAGATSCGKTQLTNAAEVVGLTAHRCRDVARFQVDNSHGIIPHELFKKPRLKPGEQDLLVWRDDFVKASRAVARFLIPAVNRLLTAATPAKYGVESRDENRSLGVRVHIHFEKTFDRSLEILELVGKCLAANQYCLAAKQPRHEPSHLRDS